jgi:hypothetical protein
MRSRMKRVATMPASWATLATVVGLVVVLGGSSWAAPAASVPRKLAADVKRALKLGKAADSRSRTAVRRANAALKAAGPGPQGPQGAQGPPGPQGERGVRGSTGAPGSGLGYTQIEYCGNPGGCEDFPREGWFSSDDTNSPGIDNTANFQTNPYPPDGIFCYHDLPFAPHVVMATVGTIGDATAASIPYLVQGRAGSAEHPLTECGFDAGTDDSRTAAIFVRDTTGALVAPDHAVRFWVLFG